MDLGKLKLGGRITQQWAVMTSCWYTIAQRWAAMTTPNTLDSLPMGKEKPFQHKKQQN